MSSVSSMAQPIGTPALAFLESREYVRSNSRAGRRPAVRGTGWGIGADLRERLFIMRRTSMRPIRMLLCPARHSACFHLSLCQTGRAPQIQKATRSSAWHNPQDICSQEPGVPASTDRVTTESPGSRRTMDSASPRFTGLARPPDGCSPAAESGAGVYRSSDNGATWQLATTGLPSSVTVYGMAVVQDSGRSNLFITVYNAVYRSTDNGTSWTSSRTGATAVRAISALGNQVFTGGTEGVYRTTNLGGHLDSR